ncbi:vegetative cell wall protein gp1-like [Hyaena hyaena]|uniref:vegetative cell wall protein gp1-like n=1 Tax=Hyaena hyaena TaxID=95912 RepID=UPI0019210606|nr:vegetative cell wall protein gp1-like [Hyaena hyaena]
MDCILKGSSRVGPKEAAQFALRTSSIRKVKLPALPPRFSGAAAARGSPTEPPRPSAGRLRRSAPAAPPRVSAGRPPAPSAAASDPAGPAAALPSPATPTREPSRSRSGARRPRTRPLPRRQEVRAPAARPLRLPPGAERGPGRPPAPLGPPAAPQPSRRAPHLGRRSPPDSPRNPLPPRRRLRLRLPPSLRPRSSTLPCPAPPRPPLPPARSAPPPPRPPRSPHWLLGAGPRPTAPSASRIGPESQEAARPLGGGAKEPPLGTIGGVSCQSRGSAYLTNR